MKNMDIKFERIYLSDKKLGKETEKVICNGETWILETEKNCCECFIHFYKEGDEKIKNDTMQFDVLGNESILYKDDLLALNDMRNAWNLLAKHQTVFFN